MMFSNDKLKRTLKMLEEGDFDYVRNELANEKDAIMNAVDVLCQKLKEGKNDVSSIIKSILGLATQKGFLENSLLYRITLVRKNLREHIILFSADHIIYDAICEEVIRRSLNKYYILRDSGKEILHDSVGSYSEYVEQIAKSPVNASEDEIIERFDFKEYSEYKRKAEEIALARRDKSNEVTAFNYSLKYDNELDEGNIWEIAYSVYMLMLKRYLGFDKIPVRIVSYGRKYENKNYFGAVGVFADLIPMLVPVDEGRPWKMAEYTYDKIAFASNHCINFYKMSFDMMAQQKWGEIAKLITPEKIEPINQMIIFNYMGKFSGKRPEEFILINSGNEKTKQDTAVAVFYTDVRYTADSIDFYFCTTIEKDTNKLKKILDDTSSNIMRLYQMKSQ